VLAGLQPDGSRIVLDDFRQAYEWIRNNTREWSAPPRMPDGRQRCTRRLCAHPMRGGALTPHSLPPPHAAPDATLLTWWDNANELRVLANRSVVADASGAHPALVADVARALLLPEATGAASGAVRALGADYVVLHFGGASGYGSDDVGKAAWMARLASAGHPGDAQLAAVAAGLPPGGRLRIDRTAHPALHASALYRLSYARFDRVVTDHNRPSGFDVARGSEMGGKGAAPSPRLWEEVHTSPHWLVRVYKVSAPVAVWCGGRRCPRSSSRAAPLVRPTCAAVVVTDGDSTPFATPCPLPTRRSRTRTATTTRTRARASVGHTTGVPACVWCEGQRGCARR
jgi:dolichyl-diphosphooligosaccharide---protein glycosyltransferase